MNSTERSGPAVSSVYQTLLEPSFSGRPMTPTLTACVPSGSARCHLIPVGVPRRTSASPSRSRRLSKPVGGVRPDAHHVRQAEHGLDVAAPRVREHRREGKGVAVDAAEDGDAPILGYPCLHVIPVCTHVTQAGW